MANEKARAKRLSTDMGGSSRAEEESRKKQDHDGARKDLHRESSEEEERGRPRGDGKGKTKRYTKERKLYSPLRLRSLDGRGTLHKQGKMNDGEFAATLTGNFSTRQVEGARINGRDLGYYRNEGEREFKQRDRKSVV